MKLSHIYKSLSVIYSLSIALQLIIDFSPLRITDQKLIDFLIDFNWVLLGLVLLIFTVAKIGNRDSIEYFLAKLISGSLCGIVLSIYFMFIYSFYPICQDFTFVEHLDNGYKKVAATCHSPGPAGGNNYHCRMEIKEYGPFLIHIRSQECGG